MWKALLLVMLLVAYLVSETSAAPAKGGSKSMMNKNRWVLGGLPATPGGARREVGAA